MYPINASAGQNVIYNGGQNSLLSTRQGDSTTLKAVTYNLSADQKRNELSLFATDDKYLAVWGGFKFAEVAHSGVPNYPEFAGVELLFKGIGYICGAIDAATGFNGTLRRQHADKNIAALQKEIEAIIRQLASKDRPGEAAGTADNTPVDYAQLQDALSQKCEKLLNCSAVMGQLEAAMKVNTDTTSFGAGSLGTALGTIICKFARAGLIEELLAHPDTALLGQLGPLIEKATDLKGFEALKAFVDGKGSGEFNELLDRHGDNLHHLHGLEIAGNTLGILFSMVNGVRGALDFSRSYRTREQLKAKENRFTHVFNALQEKAQAGKEVVGRFLSATKRRVKAAWWSCMGGLSRVLGAIGNFVINLLSLCSVSAGPAGPILGGVLLLTYFLKERMQAYHERRARRMEHELSNAIEAVTKTDDHTSHDKALFDDLKALMDPLKLQELALQTGGADCLEQVKSVIYQEGRSPEVIIKNDFNRLMQIILGPTRMERSEGLLKSGNLPLQLQGMVDKLAADPCPQFVGKASLPNGLKESDLGGSHADKVLRRNGADKAIMAATKGFFPNQRSEVPGLAPRAKKYLNATYGESRAAPVLELARGLALNGKLMTFWMRDPTEACKDLANALKSGTRALKAETLARAFTNKDGNAALIADCRFARGEADHKELVSLLSGHGTQERRASLREMTRLLGNAKDKFMAVWQLVCRLENGSRTVGLATLKTALMLHGFTAAEAERVCRELPNTATNAKAQHARFLEDKKKVQKAQSLEAASRKNTSVPDAWNEKTPSAKSVQSHLKKMTTENPQHQQMQSTRDFVTGGQGGRVSGEALDEALKTSTEEDFLMRLAGHEALQKTGAKERKDGLRQLNARQLAAVLNTGNAADIAESKNCPDSLAQSRLLRWLHNESQDHKPSRLVNVVSAIEGHDIARLKKLVLALPKSGASGDPLQTLALALFLTTHGDSFALALSKAEELKKLCAKGDDKAIKTLLVGSSPDNKRYQDLYAEIDQKRRTPADVRGQQLPERRLDESTNADDADKHTVIHAPVGTV